MTAVSVIIPARDAEATLGETLASVLGQEFVDIEAIVVDDESRDGTASIAADRAKDDGRIRIVTGPGEGVGAARNEGLRHARGDAVLFLDADDWISRGHVEQLHSALRKDENAAASYCGYVRVTPQGQAFMPRFAKDLAVDPAQDFAHRNPLASHSMLVLRQRIEAIGGFDSSLPTCEDWDLWQRLAFSGAMLTEAPGLYAFYRIGPDSLSANVTQLFSDAATVIARGFAHLGGTYKDRQLMDEAQDMALAYFGLWCRTVAAAQGQPLQNLPPLPQIQAKEERLQAAASMLLEALCTGACRTPASFARDWSATNELLDRAMIDSVVSPETREGLKLKLAGMLRVEPSSPKELVSVVIPAYRATDTIGETLASVRHQTHSALDITVVDDGSPDATPDLALAEASEDPRICVMQQKNAGVAAARNAGWKAAAADLIAFVDADDLWGPNKIALQLKALREAGEEAGLAYTWYAKIDADSHIISSNYRPLISGRVLEDIFRGNFVGNGSAALITRSALEAAGGFDSSLKDREAQGCEDFSIYFRIAEKYRFALVPEPLTGYRQLSGAMSSDMMRMVRSFELVGQEMLSRHPDHRRAIIRGQNHFMIWSLNTAAERGDFASAVRLMRKFALRAPHHMAALMLWRFPRALMRGARRRIVGTPRRRKNYKPRKFIIAGRDDCVGEEAMRA
ncbi:glycosyltransferase family 2 protein [Rhizorhapis suberifaciens]|uniref:Glycosyltransferase involved in cell wall biosynthesis n=1 Tax=Rhizorhapis suberifaciens TaxID=13656 RepID=A0A840HVB0_9SPHN|nr:glycosyltransferase [Rhizorhapis suberifaciens]MBB4641621.1 glycosyltransferase involved in cell wall biosynthesis [Rhizorhapis suberifaciens]